MLSPTELAPVCGTSGLWRRQHDDACERHPSQDWHRRLRGARWKDELETAGGDPDLLLKLSKRTVAAAEDERAALHGQHRHRRTQPSVAAPRQRTEPDICEAAQLDKRDRDVSGSKEPGRWAQRVRKPVIEAPVRVYQPAPSSAVLSNASGGFEDPPETATSRRDWRPSWAGRSTLTVDADQKDASRTIRKSN